MTAFVPVAMFGWVPLAVAIFAYFPARRAVLAGFIGAWLFLPVAVFKVDHVPEYSKNLAICVGIGIAVLLLDRQRLFCFRVRRLDVPMLAFCVSPLATAMANGQGWYEGLSAVFAQSVIWGAPYLIGRLYFDDLDSLRDLAVGIVVGGLIYAPLCLIEVVAGPILHPLVYGYSPALSDGLVRYGGWRPVVFMVSGLVVATWMAAATLGAVWLSWTRTVGRIGFLPMRACVLSLVVVVVVSKSVNGWLLLAGGVIILYAAARFRNAAPMFALLALIILYVTVRATGVWSGEELIPPVHAVFGPDRANSLDFRLFNETIIGTQVREHAMLGVGRGVTFMNDVLHMVAVPDSLWIVEFAEFGAVGLAAFFAALLAPVIWFARRYPARLWTDPRIAPGAVLCVMVCLHMVDNLANGLPDPVFPLIAGALASVVYAE